MKVEIYFRPVESPTYVIAGGNIRICYNNRWIDFRDGEIIITNERNPKVFQLNDCEWWAGHGLESTMAAYVKETGVPPEDAFDNPRELTDEEMDTMLHSGDEGSNKEPITFREELDRMIESRVEFPWPFASTEQ